jgi:hypothetical protein
MLLNVMRKTKNELPDYEPHNLSLPLWLWAAVCDAAKKEGLTHTCYYLQAVVVKHLKKNEPEIFRKWQRRLLDFFAGGD